MKLDCILILLLVAALGSTTIAIGDEPESDLDGYQEGNFGRVRFLDPGATLVRAPETDHAGDPSTAEINTPIFPGDAMLTGGGERAEVQLAGGALVRIDRLSSVTFLSLPNPYADVTDNTVLKLSNGAVRVTARGVSGSEFRVDTPAASVYLVGDADLRIEVLDGGSTRVVSRRGVAEVVGEGGSVLVRGGTRSRIEPGSLPDSPQSFNTFAEDPFDTWCASLDNSGRDRLRGSPDSTTDAYGHVPEEVRPYYVELSTHGSWVFLPTFGYAWVPGGVASEFRPYVNGYWSYGSGGYFWVSYEPWGWAPYHYGRWTWAVGHGWCWLPGRVFAGAWVSWSWGTSYVGWCPLDYWNRPCYYGDRFYGHYDPHCWTFVDPAYLSYRGGYNRHAVPVNRAGMAVSRNAMVTRPPRISPYELSKDMSARDRAFREAEAGRRARSRTSTASASASPRGFDRTETELRRRFSTAERTPDPARTGSETNPSLSQPGTPRGFRRDASAPSAMDAIRSYPRTTPSRVPKTQGPVVNRRGGEHDPEQRSVDRGAHERRVTAETIGVSRPRRDDSTERLNSRPDSGIRELYRRIAAPRAVRSPESGEDATKASLKTNSQSNPSSPPPARPPARVEPIRERAPSRSSRPASEHGHSGERGRAKRR